MRNVHFRFLSVALKRRLSKLSIVLLQSTLRFVIPYLVKKASPSSSAILRLIAKELKLNRREMLLENFKFIFSFLVRTCSPAELEKALGYVQVKLCFLCLQISFLTRICFFSEYSCVSRFVILREGKPGNPLLPRDNAKKPLGTD